MHHHLDIDRFHVMQVMQQIFHHQVEEMLVLQVKVHLMFMIGLYGECN